MLSLIARNIRGFRQRFARKSKLQFNRLPLLIRPLALATPGFLAGIAGILISFTLLSLAQGSCFLIFAILMPIIELMSVSLIVALTSVVVGGFYLAYLLVKRLLGKTGMNGRANHLLVMEALTGVSSSAGRILTGPVRKVHDFFERVHLPSRSIRRLQKPDRAQRFARPGHVARILSRVFTIPFSIASLLLDGFLLAAVGIVVILVGGSALLPLLFTNIVYSLYVRWRGNQLMSLHSELIAGIEQLPPSTRAHARRLLVEMDRASPVSKLIPHLGVDHDSEVAALLLRNLGEGERVELLQAILAARPAAIDPLRNCMTSEMCEALVNALGSKRPAIRENAAFALGELYVVRALPELRWKASPAANELSSVQNACREAVRKLEAFSALPRTAYSPSLGTGTLPSTARERQIQGDRLPKQTC